MSAPWLGVVLDLFAAAQSAPRGQGSEWENAVLAVVQAHGGVVESVPGGCRLFGHEASSGLWHQLDLVARVGCLDVIVEAKAHGGTLPKNDVLRFKAATDDFLIGLGRDVPTRPIVRAVVMLGTATLALRRYAGLHGIALVEPARWPSVVLADATSIAWPIGEGPSHSDRHAMASLVRPMQDVLAPLSGGRYLYRVLDRAMVDHALRLQDHWSEQTWANMDEGTLELPAGRPVAA